MSACKECCEEMSHLDACQDGHELIYYDASKNEAFAHCPLCEALAAKQRRDTYDTAKAEVEQRMEIERAILVGLGVSAIMHEEALGEFVMTPGMRQQAIVAFDSGWGKES